MVLYVQPAQPTNDRVLVCGGRDFADEAWLVRVLDGLHRARPIETIIHGGARGADSLAGKWAAYRAVPVKVYRADWNRHGRAAGILRNQQMLDEGRPGLVVGFPGGRGTADMLRRAKAAGVDWMQVSRDASVDTDPKGRDAKQARMRSIGSAVGVAETHKTGRSGNPGMKDMNQWMPISEAPKDGTDVLLAWRWEYDEQPWQQAVGYWHDEAEEFWLSVGQGTINDQPLTHFMFLPDPPNAEG